MLRTVTRNSRIITMKYTWYHRYREIIQITGGLPLRLHRKPGSKAGRRNWNVVTSHDMVVCHSWCNFNKIIAFCSGISICSQLFTCICRALRTSGQIVAFEWRQYSVASGLCLASKGAPKALNVEWAALWTGVFNVWFIVYTFWHNLLYLWA